jgi:hypothetical protein
VEQKAKNDVQELSGKITYMRILMTHISRIRPTKLLALGGLLTMALALVGCDREQIKVQEVPKDADPATAAMAAPAEAAAPATAPAMPANPHAGMDMGAMTAAQPQLRWTLPSGWQEKPLTEFRAASFDAKGRDGQVADVSVIPMPTSGREVDLVNMWRQQMQLPAVTDADADKAAEAVSVGSEQGKMFEFASEQPVGGNTQKARMVVAMLMRGGTSFFFKMTGADSVVTEQKPAFLDFLKSISFEAPSTVAMSNPQASMGADPMSPTEATPVSVAGLPDGWKEIPNPPMLLAKYVIQGSGDAKADVNISALAGTGGGLMMNINRWRGQLGLSPLSEEDFSKEARTMDLAGGKATLVDLTGTDKAGKRSRLVGIIAPQTDQTWFYKLIGDPQIVEQQKDAFTKFIQTAKFSNAP